MHFAKTFESLKRQIAAIRTEYRLPGPVHDAFPFWFCQALLADPEDVANIRNSLVGGKNDRNVDILFFASQARVVYVCQTKYHTKLNAHLEKPNDVMALAHLAASFAKRKDEFLSGFQNASVDVRSAMERAWNAVHAERYAIRAVFVTTGRISPHFRDEAEALVSGRSLPTGRILDIEYLVYDGKACCRLQVDFEDLVPAVPFIQFEGLPTPTRLGNPSEKLYSYVVSVPTHQIARIYQQNRERLFARNIRRSKGEKSRVNREILRSLNRYPEEFFYLNNGITILASKAEGKDDGSLRIYQPQIINGQQTTRMIARDAEAKKIDNSSSVLVKVIIRAAGDDAEVFELRQFVQRVVRATNFQNPIKLSELAANNREHVRLERALQTLRWQYIRKKGKSADPSGLAWAGANKPYGSFTLQQLTTALVACLHDPQYIRRFGIETIFEELFEEHKERLYQKLFPREGRNVDEVLFCVLCYRLAGEQFAKAETLQRSIENHGKYYVANRLHKLLTPLFRTPATRKGTLRLLGSESYRTHHPKPLKKLCRVVGQSWTAFFHNQGDGDIRQFVGDIATEDAWDKFFSRSQANTRRRNEAKDCLGILRNQLNHEDEL